MEEKNNNVKKIAIGLIVVGLILIGFGCYKLFIENSNENKDSGPTPSMTPQPNDETNENNETESSDEAVINIAKEKLEEANTYKFIGNTCNEGKEACDEEKCKMYCYYDTLDNFKKKFYSIYSTKLNYNDVFIEYNIRTDKLSDGNLGNIPEYTIKDNKVYTSGCTIGGGDYQRFDKFKIVNRSNDTIKVGYVAVYKDEYVENSSEYEEEYSMTLVKENGSWKILNAVIVDQCRGTYEVGKES